MSQLDLSKLNLLDNLTEHALLQLIENFPKDLLLDRINRYMDSRPNFNGLDFENIQYILHPEKVIVINKGFIDYRIKVADIIRIASQIKDRKVSINKDGQKAIIKFINPTNDSLDIITDFKHYILMLLIFVILTDLDITYTVYLQALIEDPYLPLILNISPKKES